MQLLRLSAKVRMPQNISYPWARENLPTQGSQNEIHYKESSHQDQRNKIHPGPWRPYCVVYLFKNKINK